MSYGLKNVIFFFLLLNNRMEKENDICPQGVENLWRAVILQAFTDACSIPSLQLHQVEIDAIRSYILGAGRDYREVCDNANLEFGYVRDAAKELRDGGWKGNDYIVMFSKL